MKRPLLDPLALTLWIIGKLNQEQLSRPISRKWMVLKAQSYISLGMAIAPFILAGLWLSYQPDRLSEAYSQPSMLQKHTYLPARLR